MITLHNTNFVQMAQLGTSENVYYCRQLKKYYFVAPQLQFLSKVINSLPYLPCVLVGKLRLWQQWKQGQLSGQFPALWT